MKEQFPPIPIRFPIVCVIGLLGILMAAGLYLRVQGAAGFYYNTDEAMHADIASGATLADVWHLAHYEVHPPLLYILLHYWMLISTAPGFVRILPLLFGLMLIPVYYRIGLQLNGPLTGLVCAALVTFGQGPISQSYLVRHYPLMLLLSALGFYCYLRWRAEPRPGWLLAYTLFNALACLTHYSAILAILCIGGYESIRLTRSGSPLTARWLFAHVLLFLLTLWLYYDWQPILIALKSYFRIQGLLPFEKRFVFSLAYPLIAPGYVLPGYELGMVLMPLLALSGFRLPSFIRQPKEFRAMLLLLCLALCLGVILAATGRYPYAGTRHNIWIMLFVIPSAGWLISDALEAAITRSGGDLGERAYPTLIILLLSVTAVSEYAIEGNFASYTKEYSIPINQWDGLNHYMEGLTSDDLLIVEKDDGVLLTNLYPALGEKAFRAISMAMLIPYRHTQLLFNPYYPRNYSNGILLDTLEQAQAQHLFDGVRRVEFLLLRWSRAPLRKLAACDRLKTDMISFPSPPAPRSEEALRTKFANILIINKDDLVRDLVAADGKGRTCFATEDNQETNYFPP